MDDGKILVLVEGEKTDYTSTVYLRVYIADYNAKLLTEEDK